MVVDEERGNRLSSEVSPYLQQHADNPVAWYPWGDEAFARARSEDKPIFLSIGYSTCHWCHVMARESFEDPEVASLMNDAFVNVKVDREERPDVDAVYMQACQMMTGQGGWPLTIVMTPGGLPFFAATYIPKRARFGMPGMIDLVPKLAEVWRDRRSDVVTTAMNISREIDRSMTPRVAGKVGSEVLDLAFEQFVDRFDRRHGGFGPPPKFPSPHDLMFLLRYWMWSGEGRALEMVTRTLTEMRRGGIYDHVGSGFHRYSTDEGWLVPHFEKMLYDQALMAMAYTEGYLATGDALYAMTARDVLDYTLRVLASPEGGFLSAEDADSDGEEGRFYLWTHEELHNALGADQARLVERTYDIRAGGNFDDPEGRRGLNVLHMKGPVQEATSPRTRCALDGLKAARDARSRPPVDDKVLTDWNGLMIAALSKASRALSEPRYAKAAENAFRFISGRLVDPDGRLLHRYRNGDASVPGLLDDHAFLVWGLIELYQTIFDPAVLSTAVDVNRAMMAHFATGNGAFFATPDDGEDLIVRRIDLRDGAVPSGNSVALDNLVRLSRLTGDHELEKAAHQLLSAFPASVAALPSGHSHLVAGTGSILRGTTEVVIVGEVDGDARPFIDALNRTLLPDTTVLVITPGLEEVSGFVGQYGRVDGLAGAYVCRGGSCERPVTDPESMMESLKSDGRIRVSGSNDDLDKDRGREDRRGRVEGGL